MTKCYFVCLVIVRQPRCQTLFGSAWLLLVTPTLVVGVGGSLRSIFLLAVCDHSTNQSASGILALSGKVRYTPGLLIRITDQVLSDLRVFDRYIQLD